VLGAWGCGVFRNDPEVVAKTFAGLLRTKGKLLDVFRQVIFAVYDRADDQRTFRAFAKVFNVSPSSISSRAKLSSIE
jgi:uncharacterized protein (TIGR02452 family)